MKFVIVMAVDLTSKWAENSFFEQELLVFILNDDGFDQNNDRSYAGSVDSIGSNIWRLHTTIADDMNPQISFHKNRSPSFTFFIPFWTLKEESTQRCLRSQLFSSQFAA